jgi:hypothetical protein
MEWSSSPLETSKEYPDVTATSQAHASELRQTFQGLGTSRPAGDGHVQDRRIDPTADEKTLDALGR